LKQHAADLPFDLAVKGKATIQYSQNKGQLEPPSVGVTSSFWALAQVP